MGKNNSVIRREGRKAFIYSHDPIEECPYNSNSHFGKIWLEGWYEEEKLFLEDIMESGEETNNEY